jgi:tetratricopeptide (TPR) repeat protein
MEEYRATLRIKPDHAQAHNNLGNALARRGELEGAIHHFREAIALDPGFAKAQNNLGNALQAQGKLEEAAKAYRRALAIDPDYAIAHHNLAGTLDSLGRPEEAAAHYRSAIRIDPGYAKARCALGWLLDREGDGAEAITQFREAARLRPDWVEPYFGIASTLAARPHLSAEDRALGIDSAERAARLSGYRDLGVLETLADAYARDGRWEDAGQTAKLGLQLATSAGADAEAGKLRAMLDRYANRSR